MTFTRLLMAALMAAPLALFTLAPLAAGGVRVTDAWTRAMPPVATAGAAYVTIVNEGAEADALVDVSSSISARAELHEHTMDGAMMRMRQVEQVAVPAGETVRFAPGGLHVMLLDLNGPLRPGERHRLELRFEHAGTIEVDVIVR